MPKDVRKEVNKVNEQKEKGLSKFNPFGAITKALDKAKKKK